MTGEELVRIKEVEVLDGFKVRLTFTDESTKVIDLDVYLRGPVFEPLRRDPQLFRSVYVDDEAGTIVWPNGFDLSTRTCCTATTSQHHGSTRRTPAAVPAVSRPRSPTGPRSP